MKHLAVTAGSPSSRVLAVNVRRLRRERGWTQLELGVKAGWRPGTARSGISAIELDLASPSLKVVDRLAAALGATPASLLEPRPCSATGGDG